MQTTEERTALSARAFEALSEKRGEPDWLLTRRREAWRLFEEAPMPDPLSDEWKRTDVSKLTLDGLVPYIAADAIESPDGLPGDLRSLWDEREELAGRLIQLESDVVYQELDGSLAAKGVIVTDLHTAAREHPEIVREHLFSTVSPAEWKYLSLHAALWSGGCLVYVPQGVEIELPIEYAAGLATPGLSLFPHLLIVAEANSHVTVIQEGASATLDGLNVISGATEIVAREGANVRLIEVQRWGRNVQYFSTTRAALAKDASLQAIVLGLGAKLARSRLDVLMEEPGARTDLTGLFFGDGDQRFEYDTLQDHIAPKSESDLLFKSALTDSSSFAWNGVINVRKTASESSANQTSRNLLLSDKASAAPTPILEISAHDVAKCSHGATVGPVDQEQIFYLQSRGIDADTAERMLVEGFFSEVLERIPSERLQSRVRTILESKLGWS